MKSLTQSGCSLVFFADLTLQEGKKEAWLDERNANFLKYKNKIATGGKVQVTVDHSTIYDVMDEISQSYGDFHYSAEHECDSAIAQYAIQKNAMAVISSDTDFLIYSGSWRLWSPDGFQVIVAKLSVKMIEYNRKYITDAFVLSQQLLPLFATLVGNDFTKYKLDGYHKKLSPKWGLKFKEIADYVKEFSNGSLSDSSLRKISLYVFDSTDTDEQKVQLIKQSLDSYKTDFSAPTIDDPIEKKLREMQTRTYRSFVLAKSSIQIIIIPFYESATSLPDLLTECLKRRIGLVWKEFKAVNSDTFTLLTKKDFNQRYKEYEGRPIYPDCK